MPQLQSSPDFSSVLFILWFCCNYWTDVILRSFARASERRNSRSSNQSSANNERRSPPRTDSPVEPTPSGSSHETINEGRSIFSSFCTMFIRAFTFLCLSSKEVARVLLENLNAPRTKWLLVFWRLVHELDKLPPTPVSDRSALWWVSCLMHFNVVLGELLAGQNPHAWHDELLCLEYRAHKCWAKKAFKLIRSTVHLGCSKGRFWPTHFEN